MKKSLLISLMLIMVIYLSNSVEAGNTEGYVPSWKVGQRWILEATYRDLRSEGEAWLPPMQWIFNVRAKKSITAKNVMSCIFMVAEPARRIRQFSGYLLTI